MVRTTLESVQHGGLVFRIGDVVLIKGEDPNVPWIASISSIFYDAKLASTAEEVARLPSDEVYLNVTWYYRISDLQVL